MGIAELTLNHGARKLKSRPMVPKETPMMIRMIKAVLILPGTAVVIVPGFLLWLSAGTAYAGVPSLPGQWQFWAGWGMLCFGVFMGAWTARLFVTIGQGTPAPWDPPQNLVVRGPYRHVRNPMISSVLLMLLGEALVLSSWPVGWWGITFFALNSVYFPPFEEKGLERRFGDEDLQGERAAMGSPPDAVGFPDLKSRPQMGTRPLGKRPGVGFWEI